MTAIEDLTLGALADQLGTGQVSSEEATRACLDRARATESLGAYLHLAEADAIEAAQASDARRQAGTALGPLDGVPVALKDIFITSSMPTTCGSRILQDFHAPYEGTAVRKLREAGAVLLGKLNLDEFAMGSSNEHSAYGPARNPWDPSRVPGGSSGGSAVAVAAGSAFGTLGTDTGGSIRQPASFCGVVGIKPTYGRVSRYGVIAFASSLDQVGPLARDVRGAGLLLDAIAGHDPNDQTSSSLAKPDLFAHLEDGVKGLRLGVPEEYFVDGMDAEVRTQVERAIATYEDLGAEIIDISLPHTEYAIATYYLLATAEASSNLARYDGVRYGQRSAGESLDDMYAATRSQGFGPEVKRRIMLGTFALSSGYYDAYYLKAQKVRTLIRDDFRAAFEEVDALITPTTPTVGFGAGEHLADPLSMYLADIFTVGCNLAGLPGVSLPCGFSEDGLPVGVQLIGPAWSEARLLRVARALERESDAGSRRPNL